MVATGVHRKWSLVGGAGWPHAAHQQLFWSRALGFEIGSAPGQTLAGIVSTDIGAEHVEAIIQTRDHGPVCWVWQCDGRVE